MTAIKQLRARQVLDCKARPMVEVEVLTNSGHIGRGAAPTGSSVGMNEAAVIRDGDPAEYGGLSVHRALGHVVDTIAPALRGLDVQHQSAIDTRMIELDGTERKTRLGGNAIYSTSVAVLRAAAAEAGVPVYRHIARGALRELPVPTFNMVNGGRYRDLIQPFNEFLVVPHGAMSVEHAVQIGVEIFNELAKVIEERTGALPMTGGSYGYAAPSSDPAEILNLMAEAAERVGHRGLISFALDCASSEMFDANSGTYLLADERVAADTLIDYAVQLSERFDLLFIEDLLDESDWAGFTRAHACIDRTLLLADDLTVTNRGYIRRAIDAQAADGFILKPNQVGTITEALAAYDLAMDNNMIAVTSGRSGGVVDDIVMDLSVGLQVPFQKNGAPRSGERIEKLNFLVRAADDIGSHEIVDLSPLLRFARPVVA